MEITTSGKSACRVDPSGLQDLESRRRLDFYLRENSLYRQARFGECVDEVEVSAMSHPLSARTVFRTLGLLLGSASPLTLFVLFLARAGTARPPLAVVVLMAASVLVSSLVGYHTGKLVSAGVQRSEELSFSKRLFATIGLGLAWGAVSGAAGGILLFLIGAFFGAVVGGLVGAIALTLFMFPYRSVKRGDFVELSHFLPISLGVTCLIAGLFVRLLIR